MLAAVPAISAPRSSRTAASRWCSIPRTSPAPAPGGARRYALPRLPPPRPSVGPPQVLVVDDQFTVRELQRTILEAAGYRVETAEGRPGGARACPPSAASTCVVTDVEMPGMDGLELLAAIRADAERGVAAGGHRHVARTTRTARRGADAGADA